MKKYASTFNITTSTLLCFCVGFYIIISIFSSKLITLYLKYFLAIIFIVYLLQILNKNPISTNDIKIFIPLLFFNFFYIIRLNNLDGVFKYFNLLAYTIYAFILYKKTWEKQQLKILYITYYIILPLLITATFGLIKINTNTISAIVFFISFFPLLYIIGYQQKLVKTHSFITLAITLILMLLTDSRSIMLAFVSGIVTYILWDIITKKKSIYKIYFGLVITVIFLITIIYPRLNKFSFYIKLNTWSLDTFGKSLFSGRQTIWSNLIDLISEKPLFGWGASSIPGNFYNTSLSSHNLYLQIALQAGMLAIIAFTIAFYCLWISFMQYKNDTRIRLVASFLIAILIHQIFEVSLTQNYFVIGLIQWTIIGLGYSFVRENKVKGNLSLSSNFKPICSFYMR